MSLPLATPAIIPTHLSPASREALGSLVMAWARETATGKLRYILHLEASQNGAKCGCECISCKSPLEAVNGGKELEQCKRRPHFRHFEGARREDCETLSARELIMETFRTTGLLTLPGRHRSASFTGLSGKTYHSSSSTEPETTRVKQFDFTDTARALLTLDDGRTLEVLLVGQASNIDPQTGLEFSKPTLLLVLDNPAELIGLDPESIHGRLQILVESGHWCHHWQDTQLEADAQADAEKLALDRFDVVADPDRLDAVFPEPPTQGVLFVSEAPPKKAPPMYVSSPGPSPWGTDPWNALPWEETPVTTPPGQDARSVAWDSKIDRSETLLHLKAKEILERERRMLFPALIARAEYVDGDGEIHRLEEEVFPQRMISFDQVMLEQPVGRTRPDIFVIPQLFDDRGTHRALIEITCTNGITPERAARIRGTGYPAIEVDLSRLAGRLTEADFTQLLVHSLAAKRWIWHPSQLTTQARLEQKLAYQASRTPELVAIDYLKAAAQCGTSTSDDEYRQGRDALARHAEELARLNVIRQEDIRKIQYDDWIAVVNRLQSIREDRGVGYKVNTGWQVINAILNERSEFFVWHPIYLMAIRTWQPALNDAQTNKVSEWRERALASLNSNSFEYRRHIYMDLLLCLLFPELEEQIKSTLPGRLPKKEDFGQDPDENAESYGLGQHNAPFKSREDWLVDLICEAAQAARMGVEPGRFVEIHIQRRPPPRAKRTTIAALDALAELIDYGYARNALSWCAPY